MIGINYSNSKSQAVMDVTWGSGRFYLNMILVCSTCLLYDWAEECFISLFGKKLSTKLMLAIKLYGKIDRFESLPQNVMKTLGYYKEQETVTLLNKNDKVFELVNTENHNFKA